MIPECWRPGELIDVKVAATGQELKVSVPHDATVGSIIRVPVPPLTLPSEHADRARRFAPVTQDEIERMRGSGDDEQPEEDADTAGSSHPSSSMEVDTTDGASQSSDANAGPSDEGLGVIAGILLDGDGGDVFDDDYEGETPSSPKRSRREQPSPPESEEDEDEHHDDSSAPVTKRPRTVSDEGDANDHEVDHAMTSPSMPDSTNTDVPISDSAPVGTTTAPSTFSSINGDTPMVWRLDGAADDDDEREVSGDADEKQAKKRRRAKHAAKHKKSFGARKREKRRAGAEAEAGGS